MNERRVWTDDSPMNLLDKLNGIESDLAQLLQKIEDQERELKRLTEMAPTPLQQMQRRARAARGNLE